MAEAQAIATETVLKVENLRTYFTLDEGLLKAVDGVSFEIGRQENLGMIGESGCGKSVTAQSVLRIVPPPGRIVSGSIKLRTRENEEIELANLPSDGDRIRKIRGREIAMIFKEPMTSLSPVHTIGNQIMEAILLHKNVDKDEARVQAIQMLDQVGIPNPQMRIDSYPHQLSGGLRQRAMIAMALSCNPSILIADEPTTALDVTIQAQILELMKSLQEQHDMSIMFITHNLGVIAEISNRVAVMYLGKVVEYASAAEIFTNPKHPYTTDLMKSVPKVGKKVKQKLAAIKGNVPIPLNRPIECGFFTRCPKAMPGKCDVKAPALVEVEPDHFVRCFLFSDEEEAVENGETA